MKEAQELRNATEQFFAQPLEVRYLAIVASVLCER